MSWCNAALLVPMLVVPMACDRTTELNKGPGCEGYRIRNGVVMLFEDTLHGADAATFRCIGNEYGVDLSHVFFGDSMIPWLDAGSFIVLPHGYTVDRHRVLFNYYAGDSIRGADPSSFEVLDAEFTKDAYAVYHWCVGADSLTRIKADPGSFHRSGLFWRDKDFVFDANGDVLVPVADHTAEQLRSLCFP